MHRQGFSLNDIKNVTKHKNLDSLKHYIRGATYEDKKSYNEALLTYSQTVEKKQNETTKRKSDKMPQPSPKKIVNNNKLNEQTPIKPSLNITNKENIPKENCIVPMYDQSEEEDNMLSGSQMVTKNQNVVNQQLRQASHLFQNANFNNCNFTFQMPK